MAPTTKATRISSAQRSSSRQRSRTRKTRAASPSPSRSSSPVKPGRKSGGKTAKVAKSSRSSSRKVKALPGRRRTPSTSATTQDQVADSASPVRISRRVEDEKVLKFTTSVSTTPSRAKTLVGTPVRAAASSSGTKANRQSRSVLQSTFQMLLQLTIGLSFSLSLFALVMAMNPGQIVIGQFRQIFGTPGLIYALVAFYHLITFILLVATCGIVTICSTGGDPINWSDPKGQRILAGPLAARLNAALQNCIEGYSMMLGALLAAIVLKVPDFFTFNILLCYIFGRVAYVIAYATDFSTVRVYSWLFCNVLCLALFALGIFKPLQAFIPMKNFV